MEKVRELRRESKPVKIECNKVTMKKFGCRGKKIDGFMRENEDKKDGRNRLIGWNIAGVRKKSKEY